MNTPEEEKIIQDYQQRLAHYELSAEEILAIRQAVKRISDQVLDHYFDSLGDL